MKNKNKRSGDIEKDEFEEWIDWRRRRWNKKKQENENKDKISEDIE